MKLKVFLDTTALLRAFAAFRKEQPPPRYMVDPCADRYTFEKCIFESYMVFRGIGGKKPDEGRGEWAEKYLKDEDDPSAVCQLTSRIHQGNSKMAFYWLNQILEAGCGIDSFELFIAGLVKAEDRATAYSELAALRELVIERSKFEALCQAFHRFLEFHGVRMLVYCQVFDYNTMLDGNISPRTLDAFARETAIPSEDFEIVFAAMTLPADLFVTDDRRLIACSMSLGLNLPMSGWRFCESGDYMGKVEEVKKLWGVNTEP